MYGVLFEVRSILVHLRGEPRSSSTTFWGCFPYLFLPYGSFQFPGAQLFGPLAKKLGLYLACSSMHFPQLHLYPGTVVVAERGKKEKKHWEFALCSWDHSSSDQRDDSPPSVLGSYKLSCPWHHRMAWSLGHKRMEKRKTKQGISPPLLSIRRPPSCSLWQDLSGTLSIGTSAHFWV